MDSAFCRQAGFEMVSRGGAMREVRNQPELRQVQPMSSPSRVVSTTWRQPT